MSDWFVAMIPLFKAAHIGALAIWCGGLIALPLMLSQHNPADKAEDYSRIRKTTHLTYTLCVTPSAVAAVVIGTWLLFLRDVFVPWFYLKLLFVAVLVAAHAWTGHIIVKVAETEGKHKPPHPFLPLAAILVSVICILWLVLAKPDLGGIVFPDWLSAPRDAQLPFEAPR